MKPNHHVGNIILAFDRDKYDLASRLSLGLKKQETEEDKKRKRKKVGCGRLSPHGGGEEPSDQSLVHGAQRELFQETGWEIPLENFQKIAVLEGYITQAKEISWEGAELKWVVHVYETIIPPDKVDSFVCGNEYDKIGWYSTRDLPFDEMIDGDRLWLPMLIKGETLRIKLLFDYEVGKTLDHKLIPEKF